jgi:FlhB-like protein
MNDTPKKSRQKAVALRYEAGQDRAPKVTAKGQGVLAERIIEIAKEHGIHIQEDPDLVTVLSKLDAPAEIPEKLYRAVAEVLAFVYRLNQGMKPPKG